MGELKYKDGPHLMIPDFNYPWNLSYENPIIGFIHNPNGLCGFNIIISDGQQSDLPITTKLGGGKANFREVKINPVDAIVKRVLIWG